MAFTPNTRAVLARTSGSTPRPVNLGPSGGRGAAGGQGPAGPPGAGFEGANVLDYGAVGDGESGDSAAIQAAFDAGEPRVYFPAGTYLVNEEIDATAAGLVIDFAPGARLRIAPATGRVIFSGARQVIRGLDFELVSTSGVEFVAALSSGAASVLEGVRARIDAACANATLLRLAGDATLATDVQIVGDGCAFNIGLDLRRQNGTEVSGVTVKGLTIDLGDSGVEQTYGAALYMRSQVSEVSDFYLAAGGRDAFPFGVIIVDGHRNILRRPNLVSASNTKYAIFRENGSEFLEIRGGQILGRNNATYYTDSEGIYNGHLAGHLKVLGTSITGWDWGVGFHGSHDTPQLRGAVIANNGSGGILIDSAIDDDDWPVSGLLLSGVYSEMQAVSNDQFILLRSGACFGFKMQACQVGYDVRVLKVETDFGSFHGANIEGNRFSATIGSAAVLEPHSLSEIFVGLNATNGSNTLSTGDFADNAILYNDPSLAGLTLGSSGSPAKLTAHYSQVFTANFADFLTAGTSFELTFAVTQAVGGDTVTASVSGALAAKSGVQFTAFVSSAGNVTLRASNTSASNHTSASGPVRFDVWKHA